jgi:uncharacterized protein (TIGR02391 family)
MTKWKRLYNAFVTYQNQSRNSNNILTFISLAVAPARFIGNSEGFEYFREQLNMRLSFIGLQYNENGKFSPVNITTTISEAEQKANHLKLKLEQRNAHSKIFEYCKAELLAENYFHTVFEAAKSVADRIRQITGLTEDGALLIDKAFPLSNPLIKINSLSNETEESEHKGFANLMRGVFGMFRNTLAHTPKITWSISEEDALDILSTISLIHRKLDNIR